MKKLTDIKKALLGKPKKKIAVACANEASTLNAVNMAYEDGLIEAILIGDKKKIEDTCEKLDIDSSRFEIVHNTDEGALYSESTKIAIELIKEGKADILMKGLVSTKKFSKTILSKQMGLPHRGFVSHITVYEWSDTNKLLFVSDVALNKYPNVFHKKLIVKLLAEMAVCLGVEKPKIVAMIPAETIDEDNKDEPVFTDAVALAKMSDEGQFSPAILEPLSLDMGWSAEVAKIKNASGNIVGDADCVLLHDYISGNVFYKNEERRKTPAAAVLYGASVPVVLPSRGDCAETKANSIALAAYIKN